MEYSFTNINKVNNYGGLENVVNKISVYLIFIKVYLGRGINCKLDLNIHI